MFITLFGIVMFSKAVHPTKALSPMLITLSGIVMLCNNPQSNKHLFRCLLHRRELWQSRFLLPTSCTLSEHRYEFQNAEYTYNHLIIKVSLFYIIVNQFSLIYLFILTRRMNQKQDIRYKFWFWKMKRSKSFVSE